MGLGGLIPVSATSASTTYLRLGDHGRPPILGPNFALRTARFPGNFLAALILPSQHRLEHDRLRAVPGASELPRDDARKIINLAGRISALRPQGCVFAGAVIPPATCLTEAILWVGVSII
jgi:hypothetical protein